MAGIFKSIYPGLDKWCVNASVVQFILPAWYATNTPKSVGQKRHKEWVFKVGISMFISVMWYAGCQVPTFFLFFPIFWTFSYLSFFFTNSSYFSYFPCYGVFFVKNKMTYCKKRHHNRACDEGYTKFPLVNPNKYVFSRFIFLLFLFYYKYFICIFQSTHLLVFLMILNQRDSLRPSKQEFKGWDYFYLMLSYFLLHTFPEHWWSRVHVIKYCTSMLQNHWNVQVTWSICEINGDGTKLVHTKDIIYWGTCVMMSENWKLGSLVVWCIFYMPEKSWLYYYGMEQSTHLPDNIRLSTRVTLARLTSIAQIIIDLVFFIMINLTWNELWNKKT